LARVLVVHRKLLAAAERAHRLCELGFEAEAYLALGTRGFRQIRANPPDAILIDLTELPSYGRYMGEMLRKQKSTRMVPLVFLEGDPEKAARTRQILPDAEFAPWQRISAAIRRAIRRPPTEPRPPENSQTPLCQKLRIREGSGVALLHAPAGIQNVIAPLPAGAWFQKEIGDAAVVLFFVKSAAALGHELPMLAREMRSGRTLWVCWPKRTSGIACDLTPDGIRTMASPYGLVDNKLCAIDETWSGTALSCRAARRTNTKVSGHNSYN
jgi:hypothetical protein